MWHKSPSDAAIWQPVACRGLHFVKKYTMKPMLRNNALLTVVNILDNVLYFSELS